MDEVLFRTALSPGIREQHDEFPLIGDPQGRMVVGQFGLSIPAFLDRYDGHDRRRRRPADVRPVLLRRRDQPRQRLARGDADLRRRPGRRLVVDVRAHVRRRRQDGVLDARPTRTPSSRRACVIPPFKLYSGGELNEDALRDHPQPGAPTGVEPRRPQRHRRGVPNGVAPHPGTVRAVRRRHVPLGARRAARPQLPGDEDVAVHRLRGRRDDQLHRLHLRRRRGLRPVRTETVADPHRRQGAARLHGQLGRSRPGRSTTTSTRTWPGCSSAST